MLDFVVFCRLFIRSLGCVRRFATPMISSSILISAFVMGLTGGPHCIAMCGTACAGLSQLNSNASKWRLSPFWQFQLGRLISYSVLGALAALSMQGLGWLTTQSVAVRPLWSLMHILGVVWGLYLLTFARQPLWLDSGAGRLWRWLRNTTIIQSGAGPFVLGCAWALLPCGLLYSALMVAGLSSHPAAGALAMAVFAFASGFSLWLGVRLWSAKSVLHNALAMRFAGLCLALVSAYGLYMGLVHKTAPWCVT